MKPQFPKQNKHKYINKQVVMSVIKYFLLNFNLSGFKMYFIMSKENRVKDKSNIKIPVMNQHFNGMCCIRKKLKLAVLGHLVLFTR